ncbi:MAG: hypothetical protein QOG52_559, partial [Frankiaceae bacterium]|nr:hypothetical protein [Frankiaceae bacterium]
TTPGSLYLAYDSNSRNYYAWTGFQPAAGAPLRVGVGLQDGGSRVAFERSATGGWHTYDICTTPDFITFVGGLPLQGRCPTPWTGQAPTIGAYGLQLVGTSTSYDLLVNVPTPWATDVHVTGPHYDQRAQASGDDSSHADLSAPFVSGGSYQITASNRGGVSVTKQIDVPALAQWPQVGQPTAHSIDKGCGAGTAADHNVTIAFDIGAAKIAEISVTFAAQAAGVADDTQFFTLTGSQLQRPRTTLTVPWPCRLPGFFAKSAGPSAAYSVYVTTGMGGSAPLTAHAGIDSAGKAAS